jgi:DNA sulfur modification protein DndC
MSLNKKVQEVTANILELYRADDLPWIIGYSGGKDSSTVLQLVWNAVESISISERQKKIYVISTDTLVENPIVAKWVELSLEKISTASEERSLGITPHRLVPALEDRFWVNLIGKGYPAPRPMFRWCTSRLKINASTEFIRNVATERGEAILFLGTRSAESSARKKSMERLKGSTRDLLSRNSDPRLDRVWVFPPISDWTSDEVWEYLIENENPWCHSNTDLFHLYRGATADAECPLVVDTSTPSCGDSRFGCYVCTMVDKDKSMSAMIQNNDDKKWMIPLAQFRDQRLNTSDDFKHRDFRRMDRKITLFERRGEPALIHGPYKQSYREELLRGLLKAQIEIQKDAPKGLEKFELISLDELEMIRTIWVDEKHEIEDSLPRIYKEEVGKRYPYLDSEDPSLFSPDDLEILKELAKSPDDADDIHYQMLREMLHIEQSYRGAYRRVGIFDALETSLRQHAFLNGHEALEFLLEQKVSSVKAEEALSEDLFQVARVRESIREETS